MSYLDWWARATAPRAAGGHLTAARLGIDTPMPSAPLTAGSIDKGLAWGGEITIAAGIVAVTATWHTVETEGGEVSDYLRGLRGGSEGRTVLISPVNDTHTIIVVHDAGSEAGDGERIFLSDDRDIALAKLDDKLQLLWRSDLDGGKGGWMQVDPGLIGTDITAAELEILSDASDADALHNHPSDLTPAEHSAIGDSAPHHLRYTNAEAIAAVPLAVYISFGTGPVTFLP